MFIPWICGSREGGCSLRVQHQDESRTHHIQKRTNYGVMPIFWSFRISAGRSVASGIIRLLASVPPPCPFWQIPARMSRNVKGPQETAARRPILGQNVKAEIRAKLIQRIQRSPRAGAPVPADENVNSLNRPPQSRRYTESGSAHKVREHKLAVILFQPCFCFHHIPCCWIVNDPCTGGITDDRRNTTSWFEVLFIRPNPKNIPVNAHNFVS